MKLRKHQFFFFTFYGCFCGMWKFLGQALNVCHSSDPGHCCDNAGSFTHCATRELLLVPLLNLSAPQFSDGRTEKPSSLLYGHLVVECGTASTYPEATCSQFSGTQVRTRKDRWKELNACCEGNPVRASFTA